MGSESSAVLSNLLNVERSPRIPGFDQKGSARRGSGWTGIVRAVVKSMADVARARRRRWSHEDPERIVYERVWADRPTVTQIREQHQDEHSRIIRAGRTVRRTKANRT